MSARSHSKPSGHELAAARASHVAVLPADTIAATREACERYKGGVHHGGGIPAVAAKIGMVVGVLYNKLNGEETSYHRLHVQDLQLICLVTGDIAPLQALCRTMNCVCFPAPDFSKVSDAALLDLFLQIQQDEGSYHAALKKAMADGEICDAELAGLTRQYFTWLGAIAEAHGRVQGLRRG